MHPRIRKIRNVRRSRRLNWLTRFRGDERGLQLVETAIVIPILLLLFAGMAEFGRFFYEYSTLAKASRVGARYLAGKAANGPNNWQANAKNIVVYGNAAGSGTPILDGLTVNNVTVTYEGGTPGIPDRVKVSITNYKHQPLFDLGALLNNNKLSLNVDVKPSVTMKYMLTQPSI